MKKLLSVLAILAISAVSFAGEAQNNEKDVQNKDAAASEAPAAAKN